MEHTDLKNRLQLELDRLVTKSKDVFSSVLGVSNSAGDFIWKGASGMAYPDREEPMTVDTPIFVTSITKMFTGAATMILVERGLISLDDPIAMFLPASLMEGLHRYKGRDYSDQLRIYHLISQTSGLPDYFEEKPKGGKSILDQIVSDGDMTWGIDDVVQITKGSLSAKFPPEPKELEGTGTQAHYADTNYQLLGAVLESVTEKPLHVVFSDLILDPLQLGSTYLHGSKAPGMSPAAHPAVIYHKLTPLFLDNAMTSFGPDGGMVSTIGDSLRFIQHFMEGKLFIHPTTLPRMKNWRSIFTPFHYGLGLMQFKLPRIFSPFSAVPELIGHSGASGAFLFHSEADQLYIGGTLNQLADRRRPVTLMLKTIKMVSEALG